jgi:hypothetical protein
LYKIIEKRLLEGAMISYAHKLKDSLTWWLGRKRPFIVNDEYQIELLFIDKVNNSAKIKVTNLKTGEVTESAEVSDDSK